MATTPTDCFRPLTCPVCAEPLEQRGRALSCSNRHSFDLAREGYVNLQPTGHGKSGITGDSAEMVEARRRIFARGHFAPLAERLAAIAASIHPSVVLDAGCGTGYYLGVLCGTLDARCCLGTDVSKEAIRRAAREHRDLVFFLNDIKHRLTIQSESIDLLLNVFAPRNTAEFARVLRDNGDLLVVIPTEEHLGELRTYFALLDIAAEKRECTIEQLAPAFTLQADEEVRYRAELQGGDAGDLLRMTPNYWHLRPEVIASADAAEAMRVTMAFRILTFRKAGAAIG